MQLEIHALGTSQKWERLMSAPTPFRRHSKCCLRACRTTRGNVLLFQIGAPEDRLTPIPVGTSEDIRVGQNGFAFGNPYGFQHTLTTGGCRTCTLMGIDVVGVLQLAMEHQN